MSSGEKDAQAPQPAGVSRESYGNNPMCLKTPTWLPPTLASHINGSCTKTSDTSAVTAGGNMQVSRIMHHVIQASTVPYRNKVYYAVKSGGITHRVLQASNVIHKCKPYYAMKSGGTMQSNPIMQGARMQAQPSMMERAHMQVPPPTQNISHDRGGRMAPRRRAGTYEASASTLRAPSMR